MFKITYDPKAKALNIKLKAKKTADSDMFGNCVVDYDETGEIINIELLEVDPSIIKNIQKKTLR